MIVHSLVISDISLVSPDFHLYSQFLDTAYHLLQGIAQRKVRWVESGVIRRLWASYCGAGYYFVVSGGLHLVFTLFLFPVSTAQIMGEFWKNRCSGTSDLAPIVLALYSRNR
jgi:hypothetical protein